MEQAIQGNNEMVFKSVDLFELTFIKLNVVAKIREKITDPRTKRKKRVKAQRQILKDCTGMFSPNTFTAIVGPSGCGKTTLLNLLSGRLLSQNLILDGQVLVNSKPTDDINIYGEKIGYVMQQDILMATFTPRECFMFIANLRLTTLSHQEKIANVEEMISVLGLKKCADTYIGNELIRGVSGGEKKRTSIGVELLINPSILFLDEPTTGLDSTTALHVIQFLNKLAQHGRTIVSTIHQPSSEIFAEFDRLIIMVQGGIVYQGSSKESPFYFQRIGFPVPLRSNPTDFYMKTMNKEGIDMKYIEQGITVSDQQVKAEFTQLIEYFNSKYRELPVNLNPTVGRPLVRTSGQGYLPFLGQIWYISKRSIVSQFRNPIDVTLRIIQIIFQAILGIILFYKKGETDFTRLQNADGAVFYMLSCVVFAGIFANLAAFNMQRSVFIRQRMSNTYSTASFFIGRNVAALPLDLLIPALFIVVFYWPVNLTNTAQCFFWALFISELCYWMSASYGLLLSAVFKDITVVMALVPVIIIPLMLVGGFFTNLRNVPKIFYPLEYISMFMYGWQAYIQNNFRDGATCADGTHCDILATKYNFRERYWLNLFLMFIIGLAMRAIAYVALYYVSNPKRVKLGSKKNKKNLQSLAQNPVINPIIEVNQNPNFMPAANVQMIPVNPYFANQNQSNFKRSPIIHGGVPSPYQDMIRNNRDSGSQSRIPLVQNHLVEPVNPVFGHGRIHTSVVVNPQNAYYQQSPYPPQYPPQQFYGQQIQYPQYQNPYPQPQVPYPQQGQYSQPTFRDDVDRVENALPNVLQPGNYKKGFFNAMRITTI